jgi:hypothetical protein
MLSPPAMQKVDDAALALAPGYSYVLEKDGLKKTSTLQ